RERGRKPPNAGIVSAREPFRPAANNLCPLDSAGGSRAGQLVPGTIRADGDGGPTTAGKHAANRGRIRRRGVKRRSNDQRRSYNLGSRAGMEWGTAYAWCNLYAGSCFTTIDCWTAYSRFCQNYACQQRILAGHDAPGWRPFWIHHYSWPVTPSTKARNLH